jgi:hypothetical protein
MTPRAGARRRRYVSHRHLPPSRERRSREVQGDRRADALQASPHTHGSRRQPFSGPPYGLDGPPPGRSRPVSRSVARHRSAHTVNRSVRMPHDDGMQSYRGAAGGPRYARHSPASVVSVRRRADPTAQRQSSPTLAPTHHGRTPAFIAAMHSCFLFRGMAMPRCFTATILHRRYAAGVYIGSAVYGPSYGPSRRRRAVAFYIGMWPSRIAAPSRPAGIAGDRRRGYRDGRGRAGGPT